MPITASPRSRSIAVMRLALADGVGAPACGEIRMRNVSFLFVWDRFHAALENVFSQPFFAVGERKSLGGLQYGLCQPN
jgi:hypothetical protein